MLSSKPKHCTSTQLEVIDDLHREEIEILNDFMRVLPTVMTIKLMNGFSAWKGRSSIILMKKRPA